MTDEGLDWEREPEPVPPPPRRAPAVTLTQAQAWLAEGILSGPAVQTQDRALQLACDALVRRWPR